MQPASRPVLASGVQASLRRDTPAARRPRVHRDERASRPGNQSGFNIVRRAREEKIERCYVNPRTSLIKLAHSMVWSEDVVE